MSPGRLIGNVIDPASWRRKRHRPRFSTRAKVRLLMITTSLPILQAVISAAAADNASQQLSHQPPVMIQRGVKIGDTVTAKGLFQAYEEIKEEYVEKAFGANQKDWVVVKEGADGLNVAMLHHPSDPTCPYGKYENEFVTSIILARRIAYLIASFPSLHSTIACHNAWIS